MAGKQTNYGYKTQPIEGHPSYRDVRTLESIIYQNKHEIKVNMYTYAWHIQEVFVYSTPLTVFSVRGAKTENFIDDEPYLRS